MHITFVWVGDILAFYAVTGFLLLAFYKRKASTILCWIVALIAIQLLIPVITMFNNGMDTSETKLPKFAEFALSSHDSSLTFLASIGARWSEMQTMVLSSFSTVYLMFLMYLLGIYFVKMELFKNMNEKKHIWNRIWIFSTIAFLITESSMLLVMPSSFEDIQWMEVFAVLGQNGGLTGSMFYMSTLAMLFLHVPRVRGVLMIFTKVGRMSLTCYLLHSIIGTILWLGYGFGLAEHIQSAGTLVISLAVYVVLVIFSTLWLKQFKYGPMEFIWRKLTYGKVKAPQTNSTACERNSFIKNLVKGEMRNYENKKGNAGYSGTGREVRSA